ISHKLGEVLAVSHRIMVLRGGRKAGELVTAEADRHAIADLMVGKAVAEVTRTPATTGAVLFELDSVSMREGSGRQSLNNVSLQLRSGEVVGVAGVSGNGQSSIAALISGLAAPTSGTMKLYGEVLEKADPRS